MRTRTQNFFLIVALGFINALTPFSIDLYLPAFTQIARDLETVVPRVSLSVSVYFIGFAVGQIFYGPLLDRFGRKRPLYFGLGLYILASLGCMASTSIEMFLAFRAVSALGGSAASVGAMAMVRDFFPAKESAKIFSLLMLVLSVSPMLAPSMGSFIVAFWNWRVMFALLAGMAVIDLLIVAFALPTGYRADKTVRLDLGSIWRGFGEVLSVRQFRTYVFAGSLSFSGLFVYIAGSPTIYMEGYGVNPSTYGLIFAVLAGGLIGGGQLNHMLVGRYGSGAVFRVMLTIQVGIGLVFFLASLAGLLGIMGATTCLFLYLTCSGITSPNASALALEPFTRNVGSASALLGFLQLGLGSLISASVGVFNGKGVLPTAAVMSVCSAVGWVYLRLNERKINGLDIVDLNNQEM